MDTSPKACIIDMTTNNIICSRAPVLSNARMRQCSQIKRDSQTTTTTIATHDTEAQLQILSGG